MSDNMKIENLKTKNNDQNNNGDDTSLKFWCNNSCLMHYIEMKPKLYQYSDKNGDINGCFSCILNAIIIAPNIDWWSYSKIMFLDKKDLEKSISDYPPDSVVFYYILCGIHIFLLFLLKDLCPRRWQ